MSSWVQDPENIAYFFATSEKGLQDYPSSFSLDYAREFSTGLDRPRGDQWCCFQSGFTESSHSNCFGLFLGGKKMSYRISLMKRWQGRDRRTTRSGSPLGSTIAWASKIVCVVFRPVWLLNWTCELSYLWVTLFVARGRILRSPSFFQGLTAKQISDLNRCHFLSNPKTLTRHPSCMIL